MNRFHLLLFSLVFSTLFFSCSVEELDTKADQTLFVIDSVNDDLASNTENVLSKTKHGDSESSGTDSEETPDNSEERTEPGDDGKIKESDPDDDGEGRIGHGDAEEEIGGSFVDPSKIKIPTGGKTEIDPDKVCPPFDKNCNGIPDDEEDLNKTGHGDSTSSGTPEDPEPDNGED